MLGHLGLHDEVGKFCWKVVTCKEFRKQDIPGDGVSGEEDEFVS